MEHYMGFGSKVVYLHMDVVNVAVYQKLLSFTEQ